MRACIAVLIVLLKQSYIDGRIRMFSLDGFRPSLTSNSKRNNRYKKDDGLHQYAIFGWYPSHVEVQLPASSRYDMVVYDAT